MKPNSDHSDSLEEKYVFLKNQFKRLLKGKSIEPSELLEEDINQSIQKFKEQKDALKESEEKYRSLYENAPLPFQSLNEDGSFKDINPAWLSTLGYSREEVVGKNFSDFLHPDWKPHFETNFPAFKKRGYVSDVEFKIRHKNGNYLHISFEGCIATHPDGSFKQTYCVFRDITEQKAIEESLKINQYYLSKAQELGKIGTWELDLVKNILTWTQENYKVFGVPYGTKMNYEKFLDIIHPDDREYVNKEWHNGLRLNNYDIEHRLLVDGKVKWVREKAEIKYNENGEPVSAIGFTQDITDFKNAQKEFKKSESKYSILANNTFDWEYWIDPHGNYIYLSPACEEITGYKPEEFTENSNLLYDITLPKYKNQVRKHFAEITEIDRHTEVFVIKNKNSKEFWIEHTCIPVYDENGKFVGRRGINRDITEFKSAEFELTESEKKYRSLFENMNQGHALHEVICDDSGKVVDYITLLVNEKYEEYLDVSKDKIIGKKASDILPKKELAKWINIFEDVALNGASKNYNLYSEFNNKHFEGIAYCPEKGKFAVSFSDVTHQKQVEEVARQQNFLLEFINSIAIPSADESNIEVLSKILLKAVKEHTGAVLATFSYYQSDKKELKLLHAEANQKLFKTILKIVGGDVTKMSYPVDNKTYDLIIKDIVGEFNSFNEVSFGVIPKLVDKAFRKSTGIDSLFPVAHVINGELYGTTMLAFKKGQAHPSIELLESFAHLMSVSLKRYKAENALKDSESRFRNLFNSMQEGVYLHRVVYDDDGNAINYRIIEANDISENILNIKKEDAVGQLATDIFKTEEAPFLEVYSKVADTGVPYTFDQYFEPMGKHFLISAFSPKKGKFATAFSDITKLKKNEQELNQNIQQLENLHNSLVDVVVNVNHKTRKIENVNKAVTAVFGYSQAECIGSNTSMFYPNHKEYLEFGKKLDETIREKREFLKTELSLKRKNGEIFTAEITSSFVKEEGKIENVLSIVRDVSERIKHENEIVQSKEKAEESEKMLRAILENSTDIIALTDINGKILDINKVEESYKKEDVVGTNVSDFLDEKDTLEFKRCVQQAIETGLPQSYYPCIKTPTGIDTYWHNKVKAWKTGSDETMLTINFSDITNLRKFENQLIEAKEKAEESEERFKLFVNQSPTPLAVTDNKIEQIIYWSESATQKVGHTPKTVSEWFSVAYPDPAYRKEVVEKWTPLVEKATKTRRATNTGEYEVTCKNGSVITVEFYVQFLPDQIIVTMNDITERKNNEEALKASRENLKSIVENGTNMFYRHDVNHQLKYVSPQIKNLLGYEVEEAMVVWTKLITENPINEIGYNYTVKAIETGERQNVYDLELRHKNGDKIMVEVKEAPIVKDGKTVEIVGALANVTEKRKMEQALKDKNDEYEILNKELIQINKELQIAKEKAEESDRLKSAFLANMSHEIRTPMNGILGFSNLLKEQHLSGKQQQHYIEIIQKSGDRMLNTVNDIIEISKIEARLVATSSEKVNINKHLSTLYHFFKLEADKKGLEMFIDKQLSEEDSRTLVDKSKLSSILTNLIKNAIKFTYKGTISFGCEKKGKMLEFYVKDTGVGIPQNRIEAIFNRFEQADIKDSRVFEGSGLGLAISKSYVEMLGGNIWVETLEDEGSTFFFTIPYNSIEAKTSEIDISKSQKAPVSKNKKASILIVEDDEVSKMHLSLILNNITDEIIHVSNGLDAVETVKNNPDIDIVLMDIRMSKMDGMKATQKIREFNKEIVIIAQTAFALEGDREKMINAGCTDYITKPIKKSNLLALIKKYS